MITQVRENGNVVFLSGKRLGLPVSNRTEGDFGQFYREIPEFYCG